MAVKLLVFIALLVPGADAVRDSSLAPAGESFSELADGGSFKIARSAGGANVSSRHGHGTCEPHHVHAWDKFCVSVQFPVYPMIKVEIAIRVKFERDGQNCFAFSVGGVAGVRVASFAVALDLEYKMTQVPKDAHTKCSMLTPGPKIITSYIVGRILQYARGDETSELSGAGDEIMSRYYEKKAEWHSSEDPLFNPQNLALSLSFIHMSTVRQYIALRSSSTPTSMPEMLNMAIQAWEQSYHFAGPANIETCFGLTADKTDYTKWMWCYFTSLYEFTPDSYHNLVRQTCLGGNSDLDVWKNMKDTSLGLNVQANPDICEGEDEECMVTVPREFMIMFPCYTWTVINYMVFSDTTYSKGAARELVLDATDKQFGMKPVITSLDYHDPSMALTYATIIGNAVKNIVDFEEPLNRKQRVMKAMRSVMRRKGPKRYEQYMLAYAQALKKRIDPDAESRGDGYASDVDVHVKKFTMKDTLAVAIRTGISEDFCETYPAMDFRWTQYINLNTWEFEKGCVTGSIKVTLLHSHEEEWAVFFNPMLCANYGTGKWEKALPVKLKHYSLNCAASFIALLIGDMEHHVCADPEYQTVKMVVNTLTALTRAGIDIGTSMVSGELTAKKVLSAFGKLVEAITAAVAAVVTNVAQSKLLHLANHALEHVMEEIEHLVPIDFHAHCAKVVEEEVDLIKALTEEGIMALKTPEVGWHTEGKVKIKVPAVGKIVIKGEEEFLATYVLDGDHDSGHGDHDSGHGDHDSHSSEGTPSTAESTPSTAEATPSTAHSGH